MGLSTSEDSQTKNSGDWRSLRIATLQELARRNPDSLLSWTLAYRYIRGKPMRLPPALHEIYRDDHPFIVIQKAAQVFITEYLINVGLWVCETCQGDRGNALYVMPTQADPGRALVFGRDDLQPLYLAGDRRKAGHLDRLRVHDVRLVGTEEDDLLDP